MRIPVCDANSCIDKFLNDLTPCHVGQHAETCESLANLLPPGGMLAERIVVSQACPPWQLGPMNLRGGASHSRLYSPWHDSVPAIGCHHLGAAPPGKTSTHDPCNMLCLCQAATTCGSLWRSIHQDCTQHIGGACSSMSCMGGTAISGMASVYQPRLHYACFSAALALEHCRGVYLGPQHIYACVHTHLLPVLGP